MYSYAREKEYVTRRATELATEMERAIAAVDVPRFLEAYHRSFRYMNGKTRKGYYIRMLVADKANREGR